MSLKDPKKIEENDDFAVFKGSDGHELKILKKGLSEKLRKELSSLPLHAAKGAIAEDFEPGKDYSKAKLPGDPISSSVPAAPDKSGSVAKSIGKLIKERGIDPVIQGVKDAAGAGATVINAGKEVAQGAGLLPEDKPIVAAPPPAAPVAQPPVEQDVAPVPRETLSTPPPSVAPQAPKQTPEQVAQTYKADADQEAENTYQDLLNGRIQPKTYSELYSDKSTLGKIGTIFGLMMSGAGSGLTKGPNLLIEMMNKEIERDLEAQKKSVDSAQNFYKLNIEKELAAVNMTKAQAETKGIWKDIERKALENSKTQLELTAMHSLMSKANLLPADKRAQAQPLVSGLQGVVAEGISQRNSRAAEQDALRALGHLGLVPGAQNIADARDERYVPGVGEAGIPVPGDVRKEIGTHQKMSDSVSDLLKYSKSHTNLIPGTPEYNLGVTKALSVQQMVREGLLGTVFRESEKPLLKKFVTDNPAGALKMISTQPRLKAILESNRISSNALKKQYDLPTEKSAPVDGGIRYDAQGNAWKLGPNGKPVRAK